MFSGVAREQRKFPFLVKVREGEWGRGKERTVFSLQSLKIIKSALKDKQINSYVKRN